MYKGIVMERTLWTNNVKTFCGGVSQGIVRYCEVLWRNSIVERYNKILPRKLYEVRSVMNSCRSIVKNYQGELL